MSIDGAEKLIRRIGALAALGASIAILSGMSRGLRHPKGRQVGAKTIFAQPFTQGSVPFYAIVTVLSLGLLYLLWRPIRAGISTPLRLAALILGTMLYFPGLALMTWGRFTMGEMHNVSTSMAVQLYVDHKLVTTGPFAWMRHPMYIGGILAELGALLLYRTWTTLLIAANIFSLMRRAKLEEHALAAQFGDQWEEYSRRVPMWLPRISR